MTRSPNLFIIGAPKCGTTSMISYLSNHPDIFVSEVKEPHYFNTDSGHRYYFEEEAYLSLFKSASPKCDYLCEGSVWYLYSNVAITNILKFNPSAKFLILLRNPTDMFFSLHQELLFGGSETESDPYKAWELQNIRKEGKKIPIGCSDPRLLQYGNACKLGSQVEKASKLIAKENIKYILLDDLKSNPDSVYNDVLKFLKIKEWHLDSYQVVNKKKVRKFSSLARLFSFITFLKKKIGIKGGMGIASKINKYNVSHDKSLSYKKDIEFQKHLKSYFLEDINLLESLINKDLTHWK